MATNKPHDKGPLYSHGWDEREDDFRRHRSDYESAWGPTQNNFSREGSRDRGGFTGQPGSNYGSGAFGGAAGGLGLGGDQYRGYYGGGGSSAGFASQYSQAYGRDDYRQYSPNEGNDSGQRSGYSNRSDGEQEASGSRKRWEGYNWEDRVSYGPATRSNRGSEQHSGPHRGKGPKNYRRSDSRIREDVSDRLSDDPYIDASDIDISVEDGNVVLSGRVENRDAKRRAADLAESIRGVTNVENRLRTGQGFMENISHAITAAIGDVTMGPDVSTVETPKRGRRKKE